MRAHRGNPYCLAMRHGLRLVSALVSAAVLAAATCGCTRSGGAANAAASTTISHTESPTAASSTTTAPAAFSDVTVSRAIPFGSAVDQTGATITLNADMYEPAGDTSASRPVVVWIHGGGFARGERTSPELVDEANEMGRQGYVGFSIDYRLSTVGCSRVDSGCVTAIIQATEDATTAVRFLRAQAATYRIDPDRIAIAGSSAGAITALNVAYASDPTAPVRAAVAISGGALPPGAIGPGDAPALLFHSRDDHTVPYSWATRTVDTAHAAGQVADLVTWDGDGHVPYVEHRREVLDRTGAFLRDHDGVSKR